MNILKRKKTCYIDHVCKKKNTLALFWSSYIAIFQDLYDFVASWPKDLAEENLKKTVYIIIKDNLYT